MSAVDGNTYPNYPLAPDFQGCGYSDPDHSWEGWLVQHNHGKLDGFLQRPTTPANNPGVTLAAANTFPIGYYTNLNLNGTHKAVPDLPVIGALAEQYTTLDRYFCAFAGETFPNRFYQHAGQTDRDHNSEVASALPTIWDQLSPIPNSKGIPTGGYYYRDSPFLALWASPAIARAQLSSTRRSSTPSPTRAQGGRGADPGNRWGCWIRPASAGAAAPGRG